MHKKRPKIPVHALKGGEVIVNEYEKTGWSITIKTICDDGKELRCAYMHLSNKSPLEIGTIVKEGDLVGYRLM